MSHRWKGECFRMEKRRTKISAVYLKSALLRSFNVSYDPEFAEKLEAIVGLYLNPPEHASNEPAPLSLNRYFAWALHSRGFRCRARSNDARAQSPCLTGLFYITAAQDNGDQPVIAARQIQFVSFFQGFARVVSGPWAIVLRAFFAGESLLCRVWVQNLGGIRAREWCHNPLHAASL